MLRSGGCGSRVVCLFACPNHSWHPLHDLPDLISTLPLCPLCITTIPISPLGSSLIHPHPNPPLPAALCSSCRATTLPPGPALLPLPFCTLGTSFLSCHLRLHRSVSSRFHFPLSSAHPISGVRVFMCDCDACAPLGCACGCLHPFSCAPRTDTFYSLPLPSFPTRRHAPRPQFSLSLPLFHPAFLMPPRGAPPLSGRLTSSPLPQTPSMHRKNETQSAGSRK